MGYALGCGGLSLSPLDDIPFSEQDLSSHHSDTGEDLVLPTLNTNDDSLDMYEPFSEDSPHFSRMMEVSRGIGLSPCPCDGQPFSFDNLA